MTDPRHNPAYPRPGCTEPACGWPDPCDGCYDAACREEMAGTCAEQDDIPEPPFVGRCLRPVHVIPGGGWWRYLADNDPWRERVEGGDWAQPLAGYGDCDGASIGHHLPCSVPRMDLCNDGPTARVTDGHHEGDPAPVIGWGESVRRVLS